MRRLLVLVVLTAACARSDRPVLRPVALPDVSSASPEVQAQIRDRFAVLERDIARGDIASDALAVSYGEMGKLLTAAEFYEAAEVCFQNARALSPGDMRWPYYLGHVFRSGNDQPQAETMFAAALVLSPQHVPTLFWLAEMHLQQNRPAEAAPLLERALAREPENAAVLYGLARVALERRDYQQAVDRFEAALRLRPDATRMHYQLALAYRGLNQTTKAEAHLRLRGEVEPAPADPLMDALRGTLQNASALEVRGSQAIAERRWADAVAALTQAVAQAPDNAFSRLNLATSLYMTGDADAALEQYRAAVRLSPGLARAHLGIGVIAGSRGRDADAIEALTAAVGADPAFVEARFSLANALRRAGRVEEALPHYEAVRRADPTVSQASFGYAIGLVRLGRYREARAELEVAERTFADQPGFAHALARLLAAAPDQSVRDGARALSIAETLLKREATLAVGETMAMALAEVGRFEDAVQWQRDVIAAATKAEQTWMLPALTANLRRYERGEPSRVPWAADDPVHRP